MNARAKSQLRPEAESGPSEAKVRRAICVVVSVFAIGAGSVIGTAEPLRQRARSAIPAMAPANTAGVVPHLPKNERSFADTRHKTVAKSTRYVSRHDGVSAPTANVAARDMRQNRLARIAQASADSDPAE